MSTQKKRKHLHFITFSTDNGGQLQITNKGFQFLLQDVNTQVWAFLLQYLDMAEVCIKIMA